MDRDVFWLVPAAGYRKPLLRLIMDLAAAHDAPVFAPHVTLGSVRSGDRTAFDAMRAVLERTAPVTLESTGIETGSSFTRSLFLGFAPCDALSELMAAFPFPSEHEPHLSLLYCPPEQREAEVGDLTNPFPTIEFDQMWVVPMTGVVRTGGDVTGWQASERIRLSS